MKNVTSDTAIRRMRLRYLSRPKGQTGWDQSRVDHCPRRLTSQSAEVIRHPNSEMYARCPHPSNGHFAMRTFVVLFPFLTGILAAQELTFGFGLGVKGGYPFTGLLVANFVAGNPLPSLSSSDNYMVGPAVELRMPLGFAIEADGLYRGTDYHLVNGGTFPTLIQSSSWEIPYLAKFRFPIPLVKPFVEGGGAYRTFNDLPSGITASHNAFVLGGGIELKIRRLRLSGELRYLRWNQPSTNILLQFLGNQGEALFGIMF